MEKVKALNGGVDKKVSNDCAMQAKSIEAINNASCNFKAAVEALDRNTAQRAISDFKDEQKNALASAQAGQPAVAKGPVP